MRYSLQHLTPVCTGTWKPGRLDELHFWQCTVCCAAYPDTPELTFAAIREVVMGYTLQELEQQGRKLLAERRR